MAFLYVTVDNPDELLTAYGAGALIRWEYSTDGSTGWAEGGTEPLVTATTYYVIEHLTTTDYYYRTRYSKATPSVDADYSEYSDVWQASALQAYATLTDLTETMALGTGTAHLNLLTDLLADVSADIDWSCMRRFYREPQVSGTTTAYADVVNGQESSLRLAIGRSAFADGRALDIVSITTLSVRDSETGSYTEIAAGDTGYYLDGPSTGVGVLGTDWPYEDVTLSAAGSAYTAWPVGKRAVKIVGVLGFPSVPRPVKRAVVSEVRERFRQSIGGGPAQIGTNAFGQPIFLTGDSPDMRRIMRAPFSLRRLAA